MCTRLYLFVFKERYGLKENAEPFFETKRMRNNKDGRRNGEMILMRVTHVTNYECTTMNPRCAHSYFIN